MGRRFRDPYLEPILTLPEGWDPQDLHQEFPGAVESLMKMSDEYDEYSHELLVRKAGGTLSVESGTLYLESDIPSSELFWNGAKWIMID